MKAQNVLRTFSILGVAALALFLSFFWNVLERETGGRVMNIGKIKVELRQRDNTKEETGDGLYQVETIAPGEVIRTDTVLYAKEESNSGFLRARILVAGVNQLQKQELLDNLDLAEGWIYNSLDGYYYYQEQIEPGREIPFYYGVHIPNTWEESGSNIRFQMEVQAEAVEADRLTPEYNREAQLTGWRGDF